MPSRPEGALGPYLRAISAHRLLVVTVTLATVMASCAWLLLRSSTYEATAQLLITPLPPDDTTFTGVQVLRESTEPTRTTQTAATLVDSRQAALLTARRLGSGWTVQRVQDAVEVKPQGESSILAVIAQADERRLAARIADVFSDAALEARERALRIQVDAAIRQLRAQIRGLEGSPPVSVDQARRLSQLEAVRNGGDPTISVSQRAGVPNSPVGPPLWLVIPLSALAGLTLASGAALLLEALAPTPRYETLRDEAEILALYQLPVLARVPSLPRRLRRGKAHTLDRMSPAVGEASRAVQAQTRRPCTILMTSGSSGDGRTTSSAAMAISLAATGQRVLLIDLDLRHPDLGRTLGVTTVRGTVPLLASSANLSELTFSVPGLPLPVSVIPASAGDDATFLTAYAPRVAEILAQAKGLADYVIVDSAPLGEVVDALRLVSAVDEIIMVARPGHTDRASFERARELLRHAGRTPAGLLVIGQAVGGSPASPSGDGWALEQSPEARSVRSASY